ncbi:hypothetical protein Cgig2_008749 [Carnegiea gigantea]|uniref:Uncharacterized protein n=1 Tax=Carnegiea gigantea TaxID=171969 RepID=A0A9Q1GQY8_9CARY|nr:hypothetical protein Cgig2_008749 [Carnegiea gigantea]
MGSVRRGGCPVEFHHNYDRYLAAIGDRESKENNESSKLYEVAPLPWHRSGPVNEQPRLEHHKHATGVDARQIIRVWQALYKAQEQTSYPREELLRKGYPSERSTIREYTRSPPACDPGLYGGDPARAERNPTRAERRQRNEAQGASCVEKATIHGFDTETLQRREIL